MQVKLKQGFGRAIRTETDTRVVAILDERAAKGQRYHRDVLAALPDLPVTDSLAEVGAVHPPGQTGALLSGGGTMTNARTELQYRIILDLAELGPGRRAADSGGNYCA